MKHKLKALMLTLLLAALPGKVWAIDILTKPDFKTSIQANNAGHGLSYTKDGDLLVFATDYVNGPSLQLVDANGDGLPASPVALAQFDSSSFGDFVQVSPNGKFAVFGLSGSSSSVFSVDLDSRTVRELFSAPGNFDFAFIDDDKGYLSSNPGGFNPSVPNVISLVVFSQGPSLTSVLEVTNTPSGAVATNENGDLYYTKSTFIYPPPALSGRLYKFSAADLAQAAVSGTPLSEAYSSINVAIDGGYDIVYQRSPTVGPQVFLSAVNEQITVYKELFSSLEPFAIVLDNTLPAVSALSIFHPLGVFDASAPSQTKIAASLTTNFFSDYSVFQIKAVGFDKDGDQVADFLDLCPDDSLKTQPMACGCGKPEADANFDAVVDCGAPKSFDKTLTPTIGAKVDKYLLVENLNGNSAEYTYEFRGPIPKNKLKKLTSKINIVDLSKLKKGSYYVRFRVSQKVGRKRVNSNWSALGVVQVG